MPTVSGRHSYLQFFCNRNCFTNKKFRLLKPYRTGSHSEDGDLFCGKRHHYDNCCASIRIWNETVVTHSTLLPWSSPNRSEKYQDANIGELANVPKFKPSTCLICRRGSSVGIATGYGLDGPRIECLWGVRFSAPVQTGPGPTQPPVQWVPNLSRE